MLKVLPLLLVASCAAPAMDKSTQSTSAPGPILLSDGESELREKFNAASDGKQLVVILSPT